MPRKTPEERFWSKVDKKGPDECWEWNTRVSNGGYARIKINGKYYQAHRVSYRLNCGPIPKGMLVLHKCDNKICLNPNHLELGNQSKNMKDRSLRGRINMKNERNPNAKLSWDKVREIRSSSLTRGELANKYGISKGHISWVKHNKSWKEVK